MVTYLTNRISSEIMGIMGICIIWLYNPGLPQALANIRPKYKGNGHKVDLELVIASTFPRGVLDLSGYSKHCIYLIDINSIR